MEVFKALGKPVRPDLSGGPSPDVLELIPWSSDDDEEVVVELRCTEFTSLCPVTGHPDFGELVVRYAPKDSLLETKSVKLFLASYRNVGGFNESLTREIARHLFNKCHPRWLSVQSGFNVRGGIAPGAFVRLAQEDRSNE